MWPSFPVLLNMYQLTQQLKSMAAMWGQGLRGKGYTFLRPGMITSKAAFDVLWLLISSMTPI